MHSSGRSAGRVAAGAVASLAALAAIASVLVASGAQIERPTRWTLGAVFSWIDDDPVSAIFTGVVVLAATATAYLAVSASAVLLAAIARLGSLPRLALVADALATPLVRRTLAGLVGLGLAVVTTERTTGVHASVVAEAADSPPTSSPPAEPAVASMRVVTPSLPAPASTPTNWTIVAGDHLWGLSDRALSDAWGRPATDAEVATYLAAVVDLNRGVLVVPGEPDLVFPGQVFARPPIPPLRPR
jgi:nucleoid-associated protein YgaU